MAHFIEILPEALGTPEEGFAEVAVGTFGSDSWVIRHDTAAPAWQQQHADVNAPPPVASNDETRSTAPASLGANTDA